MTEWAGTQEAFSELVGRESNTVTFLVAALCLGKERGLRRGGDFLEVKHKKASGQGETRKLVKPLWSAVGPKWLPG